ncbi:pirin family protein [Acidovorax sp. NCPPB 4044]|uniref:pirin family protein n=1 Tax=Acidovorax sp. NCPPB 4044 TaxID=2940490 RepID=UPI002302B18E|nr:pirin family protein [Acidovorax sp. NCPPB 4044]MDA8523559.1 pirin family protein [Acidovorax sp. NCPPB 4044]
MTTLAAASPVLSLQPLGPLWPTLDPFLFCAHHDDAYPRGNARLGPDAPLAGRQIGQDFSRKDGWSMYHGDVVPGFPPHPHRGFETVTIVRKGLIDHADSLGAAARFGQGDVQWLTAGQGVVHSEMFPLLDAAQPNPLELFQIWLNLPAADKMVPPHFTMFWAGDIPCLQSTDGEGRRTEVTVIAGSPPGASLRPLAPPPHSWAARPASDLAIWTLRLAPGARHVLPAAAGDGTRRMLYHFAGEGVRVAGEAVGHAALELRAGQPVELVNGSATEAAEFLLLQGRPLGEPVVQYGPFVMNTQAQIHEALADYRRTQFGGWPWGDGAPVHGPDARRFARRPGGAADEVPEPALPAA